MTLRNREVPRLGKAGRQLGAEEMEKRGDTPDQFGEILALEALEAHRLAAAGEMFAGQGGQRLHVAKDVATGEVSGRAGLFGRGLNYLDHAAVDNKEGVA